MLTKFHRTLLPALATGLLLLAGCGDGGDGGDGDSQSGSATSANPVDRAFVADMIPHHESAVAMATIAQRRGGTAFVKQLAGDIVRTQNAEISTMRAADTRLKRAGVAEGSLGVPEHMMGMDGEVAALKTAKPFDAAFLRMMIPHHEGALTMAKAELSKGGDAELKRLAREIMSAQQREISAMRKQLGTSGSATDDTGAGHGAGHSG